MAEHKGQFRLSSMCRVLRVQRSGYYAWKANPKSKPTMSCWQEFGNPLTTAMGFMEAHASCGTCERTV